MKKLNINQGTLLTRSQLKTIKGGGGFRPGAPGIPTGGDPIGCYKCCLIDYPTICSPEAEVPSDAVCQPGSVLTPC